MSRRKAAGKHRLVRTRKEVRSGCGDCRKRGLVGALLVPLAILAGASFDSVTKTPDAVAKVIESVGDGAPPAVIVTTTVAVPTRPEWSRSEPDAVTEPDAVATASPAEQPVAAAPQRTISPALVAEPCVTARDTGPHASKEPPAASMSVNVLPGRSAANRDGKKEALPDRPVQCG